MYTFIVMKKPTNLHLLTKEFKKQARGFDFDRFNYNRESFLNKVLKYLNPNKTDTLLEVAAGTGACGRFFSKHVHHVLCLDATLPMLEEALRLNTLKKIKNISLIRGFAQDLPFLSNSIDCALTRLSLHHFDDVDACFKDIARVIKKGGKFALIDMEAAPESKRKLNDHLETLRDPSHVKSLSDQEMINLFKKNNFEILHHSITKMPLVIQDWLDLTKTPAKIQKQLLDIFNKDIKGNNKSGFELFMKNNKLHFNQRWVLIVGKKK